jgi:hypothetical protein
MPGVREAERELRADEMRRLKAADKADKLDSGRDQTATLSGGARYYQLSSASVARGIATDEQSFVFKVAGLAAESSFTVAKTATGCYRGR